MGFPLSRNRTIFHYTIKQRKIGEHNDCYLLNGALDFFYCSMSFTSAEKYLLLMAVDLNFMSIEMLQAGHVNDFNS